MMSMVSVVSHATSLKSFKPLITLLITYGCSWLNEYTVHVIAAETDHYNGCSDRRSDRTVYRPTPCYCENNLVHTQMRKYFSVNYANNPPRG